MSLAQAAANRLLWVIVSLAVLSLMLAGMDFAREGLLRYQQELHALDGASEDLGHIAIQEAALAYARVQGIRTASTKVIQARLDEIERDLSQQRVGPTLASLPPHRLALLAWRGELVGKVRAEIQVDLWKQEQKYLVRLLQAADYRTASEQLDHLRGERDAAYAAREAEAAKYREADVRVNAFERAVGAVIPTPAVKELERARSRYYAAITKHGELYKRAAAVADTLTKHQGRTDLGSFSPSALGVTAAVQQSLVTASASIQEKIDSNWLFHLADNWWPYVASAAKVIASGIVFLLAWKSLFFFVAAPWVAGRPSIRINADVVGTYLKGGPSAVSLRVALAAGQEILVKNSYLQDSPSDAKANTRLLLSAQYPFASFASGMFGLTHIEATTGTAVTVSSAVDPLDELAEIPLSPSSGFVLLPRFLVGVVQDGRRPIVIKSVWRLGSLQAWLTCQFRFLVFYGPGTVIVRGCRGARIDRADGRGRIAQAATIGFSASLEYSNGRTETFAPYLLGMKPLFNDSFRGEGFYAYQEVPASGQRANGVGGRLMGLLDVLLRPLGI